MSFLLLSCGQIIQSQPAINEAEEIKETVAVQAPITHGAERLETYLSQLEGKRIAVVANQTSLVEGSHLVDTLLSNGIEISHVYAPEHGFRGDKGAGEHISDETDAKTGLEIYSLHGSSKKPSASSLKNIDIVLFDIQDVGVRFYTYLSTLHYVMEACAENGVKVMVLDRPNPNGNYMDGPVLEKKFSSFIGLHPVPVVYGMTIGEYAKMINGQGWLKGGVQAELEVIPCENYSRSMEYVLPVAPSPNLPNQASIYLYPSLAFFEGTVVSIGRGTDHPFEIVGHPLFGLGSYAFTPEPNEGASKPKLEGKVCYGQFLGPERAELVHQSGQLDLDILLEYYKFLKDKTVFFNKDGFFELLAGTDVLRNQILEGKSEDEIRDSWQEDLEAFRSIRAKHLIYQD
jgi:uncharacterized protein YbbC (DUF1343 family)